MTRRRFAERAYRPRLEGNDSLCGMLRAGIAEGGFPARVGSRSLLDGGACLVRGYDRRTDLLLGEEAITVLVASSARSGGSTGSRLDNPAVMTSSGSTMNPRVRKYKTFWEGGKVLI